MTAATPEPRPEGILIAARRDAHKPRLSRGAAAKRAEADGISTFSEAVWANIENGYSYAGGVRVPYKGTAEKVARAARVVRITPVELAGCDRADAAKYLQEIGDWQSAGGAPAAADGPDDAVAAELAAIRREMTELKRGQEDIRRRLRKEDPPEDIPRQPGEEDPPAAHEVSG